MYFGIFLSTFQQTDQLVKSKLIKLLIDKLRRGNQDFFLYIRFHQDGFCFRYGKSKVMKVGKTNHNFLTKLL